MELDPSGFSLFSSQSIHIKNDESVNSEKILKEQKTPNVHVSNSQTHKRAQSTQIIDIEKRKEIIRK
jgi:hypothetical protein